MLRSFFAAILPSPALLNTVIDYFAKINLHIRVTIHSNHDDACWEIKESLWHGIIFTIL